MLSPLDVVSVSGKTDAVVSSIVGANTPSTPQETVKKVYLEAESEAVMSLHQKSIPESPSSSVSSQKSITSRPADESLESPHDIEAWLDASVSQSKIHPSTRSVFDSKQTSQSSTSTLLNEDRSQTQDILAILQAECINLISLNKNMAHAGENASFPKSVDINCLQRPSQMKVGMWDSEGRKVALAPILPSAPSVASTEDQLVGYRVPPKDLVPYSVSPNDTSEKQPGINVHSQNVDTNDSQVTSSLEEAGNQISGQTSRPQSLAETDSTAVVQRPLNSAEVNGRHQLAHCLSAPASGHYGWCNQTVNDTHRQVSSSAEAVHATPGNNTLGVFHVNQISAGQEAKGFGHLGSQKPPGGIGLEMQQQILHLLHQQQILQQQLQSQMQQQMHQFQMLQPQTYQVHQYQLYQQQGNQGQGEHQVQPVIHQYQIYPHQTQQQLHPNKMYQQQQSNQDQVQQHYGQYCTRTSMAPNQSNFPLPAQANVECDIHRISSAQHDDNLAMQNIYPSSHGEHHHSPNHPHYHSS